MKIILHIGTEKTGSTSIQNFLFLNRHRLIKKGVVPTCALGREFGQNNFELILAIDEESSKGLQKYRTASFPEYSKRIRSVLRQSINNAENNNAEKIVFSSEHLSSRLVTIESLNKLKSLFDCEHSFEIICYLRRQDQLILGAQAESIKCGHTNLKMKNPLMTLTEQRYGEVAPKNRTAL